MKYYSGSGLLNRVINNLPFEMHLPSYNFCGPGTKLEKRLARGDRGVNGLDEACREHDIAYSREKDLKRRHDADTILRDKALGRYFSRNARVDEKLAALGVAGAMQAKVKLGMAYNSPLPPPGSKVMNVCLKSVEKLKKTTEKSLLNIEKCLKKIKQFKLNVKPVRNARKIRKQAKIKKVKNRRKVVEEEEYPIPKFTLIEKKFDPKDVNKVTVKNVTESAPPISRKRKLIDNKVKPTKFTLIEKKFDPKNANKVTVKNVTESAPPISRKRKLIDNKVKPTKFTLIEKKFDPKDVNKVTVKNITESAPPISRKRKLIDDNDNLKRVKPIAINENVLDTQICRKRKFDDDDDDDDETSFSVKRSKLF